jgi:hypothetical protein
MAADSGSLSSPEENEVRMTDRKQLEALVRIGNQWRLTPIVDDDFVALKDKFDLELGRATAHVARDFPKIVCLCGSTRFGAAFRDATLMETLAGSIVLSVGCMTQSDEQLRGTVTSEVKNRLDELHLRKIDMADEVFILNVGGYIGSSTRNELCYAVRLGKKVRFLEGCATEIIRSIKNGTST